MRGFFAALRMTLLLGCAKDTAIWVAKDAAFGLCGCAEENNSDGNRNRQLAMRSRQEKPQPATTRLGRPVSGVG